MRNRILSIFTLVLILIAFPGIALAQSSVYTPPPKSIAALKEIQFDKAVPVDEAYRKEFERCDQGQCSGDPNNVKALLKFPDGTIFFESKLSLDLDASWKACNDPGPSDQCETTYKWSGLNGNSRFVESDKFPFIVIPITNKDFRNKTGVAIGDLGVVVYRDKTVPVFVADGGPSFRLGEGSSALFKELGEDRCRKLNSSGHCIKYGEFSIEDKVLFFVFPRSEVNGLNPTTALATVRNEALKRFQKLKTINKTVLKVIEPISGKVVPANTLTTFSGTAEPVVSNLVVTIGPGGPFKIADLNDVKGTWSFTVTFQNSGDNRPLTFSAFDSSGASLGDVTSTITVK